MDKTLKIYNPNDVPFGPLSNNAVHFMVIDKKRWATVTNYILSNMLITPTYRLAMQTATIQGNKKKTNIEDKVRQAVANVEVRRNAVVTPQEFEKIRERVLREVSLQRMNIYQLYNYYLGQEYYDMVRKSVDKAYTALVSQDADMTTTLIHTGNRPIFYSSDNPILGIGPNEQGANLIGKILMQLRHNLRIQEKVRQQEKTQQEKNNDILQAYHAYTILQQEIHAGNDLQDYTGLTASAILKKYTDENPDKKLDYRPALLDSVLSLYSSGQLPAVRAEIEEPGSMTKYILTEGLPEIRQKIRNRRNKKIVQLYLQYVLKNKFPNMDKSQLKKASKQLDLSAPTPEQYFTILTKIINLYNSGSLPQDLSEKISSQLDKLPTLDSEESDSEAENNDENSQSEDREENSKSDSSSDDISDDPLSQLLGTDKKSRKMYLIKKLQSHTGRATEKYRGLSIQKLEKKLSKYEGKWVIKVMHKYTNGSSGKVKYSQEIIEELDEKPTQEYLDKLIRKYNAKTNRTSSYQVSVSWVPEAEQDNEDVKENSVQEEDTLYIKENGTPIYINPVVKNNSPEFQRFSPLFPEELTIGDYSYPNISTYITVMLMTQTGGSAEPVTPAIQGPEGFPGQGYSYYRRTLSKRGIPVEQARAKLTKRIYTDKKTGRKITEFYDIDKLNEIYNNEKVDTYKKSMLTLATVALKKKFEDIYLQNLLLLTGKRKILWNDPNDTFLGDGENMVGKIIMKIRKGIKPISITVREDKIASLISTDQFIFDWVKRRLSDMCGVIFRMKKYLLDQGDTEQDIDTRFVKKILDIIYYPCSGLSTIAEKITSTPTEQFRRAVEMCSGMPNMVSKNYDADINRLQDTIIDLDNPAGKQMSDKKGLKEFEQQQLKEWTNFTNQLDRDTMNIKEIERLERQIIRAKEAKEACEDTGENIREMEDRLLRGSRSPAERKALLDQLAQEQDRKKAEYLDIRKRSLEEIKAEETKIKELKSQIVDLNRQKKEDITHYSILVTEIAQIYWAHILAMVHFLVRNLQDPTDANVRKAIVSIEELVSGQTVCQPILDEFNEDQDNCIASAILNLLERIQKFKYEYSEKIPFDTPDIDLATSIVLNKDVTEQGKEQPSEPIEEVDGIEFVEDMGTEESADIDDWMREADDDDSATFGMNKKPVTRIEILKMKLREIGGANIPANTLEEMARYLSSAISTVKSAKMPVNVKHNRINFFAST